MEQSLTAALATTGGAADYRAALGLPEAEDDAPGEEIRAKIWSKVLCGPVARRGPKLCMEGGEKERRTVWPATGL